MSRSKFIPILAVVLGAVAILVMVLLQDRSSDGRHAQLEITRARWR